ncbi:mce related family protein [Mycobacterium xenopi 3993]|nr:mce related family protein [Mycobacterium xenopi 3993]
MKTKRREAGLHPALWTVILIASITGGILLTIAAFNRDLQPYARVTLASDRAGLVMEPGAKVKLRGVQVGRVASIQPGDPVKLRLELYPEQLKYIPANVTAQITATTAFGAKYVDLLIPEHPSPKRLASGAVVISRNVSTEVNTVFENLVGVLNQVDTPSSTLCSPRWVMLCAARVKPSARPPPTSTRSCRKSIPAVKPSAPTGGR